MSERPAPLPFLHLFAEMSAYPIASELSFRLGLTSLDPRCLDLTSTLWHGAEQELFKSFPGFSLDEGIASRDCSWFGLAASKCPAQHHPQPGARCLDEFLVSLAERVLLVRGNYAEPTVPDEMGPREHSVPPGADHRWFWRWLSFALPPDLLQGALGSTGPLPVEIRSITPILSRHLKEQHFAESHLHLGAALDFPTAWIGTMHRLSALDAHTLDLTSPGSCFSEGRDLPGWLLRAVIARLLMASFLADPAGGTFASFIQRQTGRCVRHLGLGGWTQLLRALEELLHGQFHSRGPTPSTVARFFRALSGLATTRRPGTLAELVASDPISPLFPFCPSPEILEATFVAKALTHIRQQRDDCLKGGGEDRHPFFAMLFWQYVRVRCLYYRHLVQRPLTPGLLWFVRFYDRNREARNPFPNRLKARLAAHLAGADEGLVSLEVRAVPGTSRTVLLRELERFDGALATSPHGLERGVVVHFARTRAGGVPEGSPGARWIDTHADPSVYPRRPTNQACCLESSPHGNHWRPTNPTGYRYAAYYMEKRQEALSLGWVLRHFPLTLEIVRGIDICTDEMGVPNWVFVPLFRYVRACAELAERNLFRRAGISIRPFGTTVHCGEDFVHLMTGLRRIDESIEYLSLREGDRLGHAVALGIDPRRWAGQAGRVAIPRQERLFDLVWEWRWTSRQGTHPTLRPSYLDKEIRRLSRMVFGRERSPHAMSEFVRRLHDEGCLACVGFPGHGIHRGMGCPEKVLLRDYLRRPEIFHRSFENEVVAPAEEGEILAHLQAELRRKVGQQGIVVEINPSSNLLIGNLADLTHHPLWRLRPPRGGGDVPPVAVCIGSDDPLTFATTLRQEYQLLADAMAFGGLSDDESRRWLDRVRCAGLEARFTVQRSTDMLPRKLPVLSEKVPMPL